MSQPKSPELKIIFLIWIIASILRLYFWVGFGLGDDANEMLSVEAFLNHGFLPAQYMHYRILSIIPRAFAVRSLPEQWREYAFILPIYFTAIATNACTILLTNKMFGGRVALLVALIFLFSPYENLCATANVPDYIHTLFGIITASACLEGVRKQSKVWMCLAALAFTVGLLNRLAMFLFLPTIVLASVYSLFFGSSLSVPGSKSRFRQMLGCWATFYLTLLLLICLICLADHKYSGEFFRWWHFNSGGAHKIARDLAYTLLVYPRYIFSLNEMGTYMFGLIGYCFAGGTIAAIWILFKRNENADRRGQALFILLLFCFMLTVEFMPHKLSLEGYFSHNRIFRYLAQATPALYICAAYFLNFLLNFRFKKLYLGAFAVSAVLMFTANEIIPTVNPLIDANGDLRHLAKYLREHRPSPGETVYIDSWRAISLSALLPRDYNVTWKAEVYKGDTPGDRAPFFRDIKPGIVITGGAMLPWYANLEWQLRFKGSNFSPPLNWTLLEMYRRPIEKWRVEPLRIWRVETGGG